MKEGSTGFRATLSRYRLSLTLATAAALVVTVGLIRPRINDNAGLDPDDYWAMKTAWRGCADAVIAGDSRVYKAVSPAVMKQFLGERRILNYGFSGNGYTAEYLRAIEEVLAADGGEKIIVLGITPHALTQRACATNGFKDLRRPTKGRPRLLALLERKLDEPFGGVRLKGLPSLVLGGPRFTKRFHNHYHEDGWAPGGQNPETDEAVEYYRGLFKNNPVSDEIVARVEAAVVRWRARGIAVYGFRPPTTPGMLALEDGDGGFDEARFVARFERAGGVWLPVPGTGYASYDGSHLRDDAALRFSADLAPQLAAVRSTTPQR
ncbi:MAG: hypothetical protein EXR72_14020 [Myxococcales bacterium]|nr:hypothetical protein [Myxococcales bacterium]